jgi:DNA polymerase-3 subunit beta
MKMGEGSVLVQMDAPVLKRAIHQTIIATSNDELRPAMNGVYMDFSKEGATFVATDSHRLVRYKRLDVAAEAKKPFIVPRKTLTLLNALLPNEELLVDIAFSDNNVNFALGPTSMVSRLLDERYPDYENVIPAENPNRLTIDRLSFLSSLKRIAIYANKTTPQIKLEIKGNTLQIFAEDFDFANEASEQLPCAYQGEELVLGFNAKFLIEMLNNLTVPEVEMHFSSPSKAGLIFPKEQEKEEDLLQLIMPMIVKKGAN